MRRLLIASLLIGFASMVAIANGRQGDDALLDGEWYAVSAFVSGKAVGHRELRSWALVFEKKQVRFEFSGLFMQGPYRINPGKRPKEIDIEFDGEPLDKYFGIYELFGDSLKVVMVQDGPRPKGFGPDGQKGLVVSLTLKRQKP